MKIRFLVLFAVLLSSVCAQQLVTDLTIQRTLKMTGKISPSQITSNQNDYAPTSFSTAAILRLSTDASRTLTGLAGGADGRYLLISNVGSYDIVLAAESSSSTAANRFALGSTLTLSASGGTVALVYDGTSSRWRPLVPQGGSFENPLTFSAPLSRTGNTISIPAASGSVNGYLTSSDWTAFNAKEATLTFNTPLSRSTNTISIANAAADGTTKGAATFTTADFNDSSGLISIDYTNGQAASGSTKGFLSSSDWTTFNNKFGTSTPVDSLDAARFAADAGASDTYTATLSPAPSAYVTGVHYRFKANTANTGTATINFNSLGAKTIKKAAGGITTDLADNDIRAGQWVDLVYDGTNMQMQSMLGNVPAGSGTVNSGTAGQLAYYATSGTAVSGLTSANSSILVTDGSGTPSLSTTLPAHTSGTITVGASGGTISAAATGNISLIAAGTNQPITLTSSGTGAVVLGNALPRIKAGSTNNVQDQTIVQPASGNINGYLGIAPAGTATESSLWLLSDSGVNTADKAYFGFGGGFSGSISGAWSFGSLVFANASADARPIAFVTSNSSSGRFEVLRIINSGNVLIGTTSSTGLTGAGGMIVGSTTDASSASAGALIVSGGVAVAKKIISGSSITSNAATSGVGYSTGAGGSVTQATSRTTGVTLNKVCGAITTNTTSLAAVTSATFTVTNSAVAATDCVVLSIKSGQTNKETQASVSAVAAGSFDITVYNANASTAETGAIVINFAVIKAVTS